MTTKRKKKGIVVTVQRGTPDEEFCTAAPDREQYFSTVCYSNGKDRSSFVSRREIRE